MGQLDVIKLLEKSDKALSRTEIANKLGEQVTNVSNDLKKLLDWGEITFIELDRIESRKLNPRCLRRTRLYKLK